MITSILLGGLTHHYILSTANYCNKINSNGSILNPYSIAMIGTNKIKSGIIIGKDSVCSPIYGSITSYNIYNNLDLMIGGYNTNIKQFHKKNIEPPSINGITPVLGLDYRIKLQNNITLDTLVSVGIITHALRVDF